MSKRRYYRSRKVYPKQKWMPVNNDVTVNGVGVDAGSYVIRYEPITQNATRTLSTGAGNVSSASIIKTGRFKYKGVFMTPVAGVSYIVGIAYIPEGYNLNPNVSLANNTIGETFFYKHPEWILCWNRIDYLQANQNNEVRLSSKLKRNLNSGDGIVVFVISINPNTQNMSASTLYGTVSYVCRTN